MIAKAHLVGSFNIGLGGQYATWAGTVLTPEELIVVIAEPGREEEAAKRLGRIGFDRVSGYLRDGIQALEGRPDLVDGWDRIDAATLAEELSSPSRPLVVDVRGPKERELKYIKGSVSIPPEPAEKESFRVTQRSDARRTLRGRISVLDRGQHPAAAGLHGDRRVGRWHGGLGSGQSGNNRGGYLGERRLERRPDWLGCAKIPLPGSPNKPECEASGNQNRPVVGRPNDQPLQNCLQARRGRHRSLGYRAKDSKLVRIKHHRPAQ